MTVKFNIVIYVLLNTLYTLFDGIVDVAVYTTILLYCNTYIYHTTITNYKSHLMVCIHRNKTKQH